MNVRLVIPLLGFLFLFVAQSASGFALYFLTLDRPLSMARFLETATPHVAAIATMSFILGHFLAFVPRLSLSSKIALSAGMMFSGVGNALSGGVVVWCGPRCAPLKLATFTVFQLFWLCATVVILKSALSSLHHGWPASSRKR